MNLMTHPAVLVGLGGACGSIGRYYIGRWLNLRAGHGIPWGTFVVNVLGSFLVVVFALILLQRVRPELRSAYLLLGTGFCGGFTTFSALELETFQLAQEGAWPLAVAYLVGSIVAGMVAVLVAVGLVRLLCGPSAPT
jgi:CrcB protein